VDGTSVEYSNIVGDPVGWDDAVFAGLDEGESLLTFRNDGDEEGD